MATAARIDDQALEARVRHELAAAFRLVAHFGWDDHVATHMSARLPDGTFLLNPFGLLFEEVTASCFLRLDMAGNVLENPGGFLLNPAGFGVHSAVLDGRADAMCAIHLHSRDGVAVSALREGLLPLSQNALNIWGDIAYHDYEGVVDAAREKDAMQRDLGAKHLMILRNHGTLSLGRSVASAFYRIYALEWACTAQVRTLSMGRELEMPDADVVANLLQVTNPGWVDGFAEERFFPAMLRKAERLFPDFAD